MLQNRSLFHSKEIWFAPFCLSVFDVDFNSNFLLLIRSILIYVIFAGKQRRSFGCYRIIKMANHSQKRFMSALCLDCVLILLQAVDVGIAVFGRDLSAIDRGSKCC